MSENGIETGGFEDFGQGDNSEGGGNGVNPAWNDVLAVVPKDLHNQVIPHFRNWDSGVQQKIQSVHSDYADYKFLKENNVSAEDTRIALGILRAIQEDPKSVYDSLATSYGYGQPEQGQPEIPEALKGVPPEVLAQIEQLQGGYQTMAQILLQKQEQEQAAQADFQLDQELNALKKKHGNFDENYVLAYMQQGMPGDQAVKAYQQMVDQILADRSRPQAPKLLGSGSNGVPGDGRIDVRKLDPAKTKNLVIEMLKAQQGQ